MHAYSVALSGPTLWPNGLGRQASVHGITQARILEWVAISSSRGFSWFRDQVHFCVLSGHLKKKNSGMKWNWQSEEQPDLECGRGKEN